MLQYLNPLRWKRSFLFSVLIGFFLIWFGFVDTYSLLTRIQLSAEKADLEEKIEALKQETSVLETKIAVLKADPDILERIAREQYGMRKDGEKVYRIIVR